MKPTEHEQRLMTMAYIHGCERGRMEFVKVNHNAEIYYADPEECAKHWLEKILAGNEFDYLLSQLK